MPIIKSPEVLRAEALGLIPTIDIHATKSVVGGAIKDVGNSVVDVAKLGVQGLMVIPNALNGGKSLLGKEWDPKTGLFKSVDKVIDKADQAGHWVGQHFVKYITGGAVDLSKSIYEKGGLENSGALDYAANYASNNSDKILDAAGNVLANVNLSVSDVNLGGGGQGGSGVDLGNVLGTINAPSVNIPSVDLSNVGQSAEGAIGNLVPVLPASVLPAAASKGPPRNPNFLSTLKKTYNK